MKQWMVELLIDAGGYFPVAKTFETDNITVASLFDGDLLADVRRRIDEVRRAAAEMEAKLNEWGV